MGLGQACTRLICRNRFRHFLCRCEQEPIVNLQELLGDIYDQSGYDLVIDYNEEPVPPLEKEEVTWLVNWMNQCESD
ncbi:MAG: DUF4058 family protein [Cyanobacteria bacterium P01_D01_bin.2]